MLHREYHGILRTSVTFWSLQARFRKFDYGCQLDRPTLWRAVYYVLNAEINPSFAGMSFVYSTKLTPFALSLAMDDEVNPTAEVVLVASNIPYPTIYAALT